MRRRGGEEEQATDIKSNNPHLAGGEKVHLKPTAAGQQYRDTMWIFPFHTNKKSISFMYMACICRYLNDIERV